MTAIIIIILAILLTLKLTGIFPKSKTPEKIVNSILSQTDVLPSDTPLKYSRTFYIAGLKHHKYANAKEGTLLGYTKPEPTNPYDSHAIALYSWNHKLIGYIARERQDKYHAYADPHTSLAIIARLSYRYSFDNTYQLIGDITILLGSPDKTSEALHQELSKCATNHTTIL